MRVEQILVHCWAQMPAASVQQTKDVQTDDDDDRNAGEIQNDVTHKYSPF